MSENKMDASETPELDEIAREVTVLTGQPATGSCSTNIASLISSSLQAVHGTCGVEETASARPEAVQSSTTAASNANEPRLATIDACPWSIATTPSNADRSRSPSSVLLSTPLQTTTATHAQNSNNCNSYTSFASSSLQETGLHLPPYSLNPPSTPFDVGPSPPSEPPRKKSKSGGGSGGKYGNIEVALEGKNLWDEFYRRGTEMIVNRAGRRMFPGFAVSISGLKPKTKYTMKLQMVLADNHRFKFLNARWLAVGTAEPQPLSETHVHPDSPNSGAFWMRHGVSFRKLKITNNKEKPGSNALLHSMHKYFVRLVVEEERKTPPGEEKVSPKTVLSTDFPETTFVAVTAYQNEEVTQLKISNNPFAKAFRENAADMDWETAQMLYGHQPIYSDHFGAMAAGAHLLSAGPWPQHSPLFPPTPLTASLHPLSPMSGLTPHSGSYFSPTHIRYDPTAPTQYFQWPQVPPQRTGSSHQEHYSYHSHHKPPIPAEQYTFSVPSISAHHSGNLPGFDSVFTPPIHPTSSSHV